MLLHAVSFLPSGYIEDNVKHSAEELERGASPLLGDDRMAYIMDYNTDALIIMESYTLSADDAQSVFSNPMRYNGEDSQRRSLIELCEGQPTNNNYVRYWMGFRVLIRPLLMVFSYSGICWLISIFFFALAFAVVAFAAAKASVRSALCYAAALCLINPSIAAHSPQFSCCFLLGFAFCIYMLAADKRGKRYAFLFCAFGTLTQYFDFYTAPLVTLGFPLLMLLESGRLSGHTIRRTLRCIALWLYGYAAMWLCKLGMTGIFTGINGFADGLNSLGGRLGVSVVAGFEEYYSVARALRSVWSTAFPGSLTLPSALVFAAAVLMACVVYICRGIREEKELAAAELIVTLLPLAWYAVAAQPSSIHAWFQYRSLAVLFFGAFLFVSRAAALLIRHR